MTRQTIVAIEKVKYSPSLEVAFRIAYVFNTPLEEVFSFELETETSQAPSETASPVVLKKGRLAGSQ